MSNENSNSAAAADAGGLSAPAEAVQLLGAVFDAWENGDDCYEDGDPDNSYMGKCFQLDDEIFKRCCDLLNRENPPRNAPAYSNEDARILRLQLENLLANPAPLPMMPKDVFDAAAAANREAINKANAALAVVANRAPAMGAGSLILKGVGKIDGDGWKDTTRKGEVVFVWNTEMPKPYAPGQYPRIGNQCGWTASTDQYDFTPATAQEASEAVEAIIEALHDRPAASRAAQSPVVAPGWKLVPVEPTIEMMDGAFDNISLSDAHTTYGVTEHVWAFMLAAAPLPPKEG
jgi:hypothetical protein